MRAQFLLLGVIALPTVQAASAQAPARGDREPLLRVSAGGPMSFVTSLALSADGKALYVGGWDKVVRVWALNKKGRFVPDHVSAYRVPIGPGLEGAINAIALSQDETWLAVAGWGAYRQGPGFRRGGVIGPTLGARQMQRDMGAIYVFNTRNQAVRRLEAEEQRGAVLALAFAPPHPGKPPLLVSVTQEARGEKGPRRVARLWDVSKGEPLGELAGLPAGVSARPGLTAWHTGPRLRQVQVALAAGDGTFRVWDVAKARARAVAGLGHGLGVARSPEPAPSAKTPAVVLTAGYGPPLTGSGTWGARLRVWEVPAGAPPRPKRTRAVGKGDTMPQALGLLSSRADGKVNLAAVVVWVPAAREYRLRVIDLSPARLGAVRAERQLWRGPARQPALATSRKGGHVAVAGNNSHEVWIYSVEALLAKGPALPRQGFQKLASVGTPFRHVSFASKGKDLGLLLNVAPRRGPGEPPPGPDRARGDLIFDFKSRELQPAGPGWEVAAPEPGEWKATHNVPAGAPAYLAVSRGKKEVARVILPARWALSDYALLPPGKGRAALLAVAGHDLAQPSLILYNAETGQPLRHYTGHVEPLHSLAFSPDGRLLVSAADDQTVQVWSLVDVGEILGEHGVLPGVTVTRGPWWWPGSVLVAEVRAGSPARGILRPGDVLAGVVEKDGLRALASVGDFYEVLWRMKPGQAVTLRRGDPRGKDDLELRVGQGIDERKPLFSLFVSNGKAGPREWVGWSPLGPYEYSSRRAEDYLGWHFNVGDGGRPTRFSPAPAHHNAYYRKGILDQLVRVGRLPPFKPLPLPPPRLDAWIRDGGVGLRPKADSVLVVRQGRVDLRVRVLDRPPASLEALAWKLDGGAEVKLALDRADGPLSVPLELRPRTDHQVVLTARTPEIPPRSEVVKLTVRYQPPPPRVEELVKAPRAYVKKADFDLKTQVWPGSNGARGEAVRVTLQHWHAGKDLLGGETKTYPGGDKPIPIHRPLKLRRGRNTVVVIAVNRDARAAPDRETDRRELEVIFPEKDRPPEITFEGAVRVTGAREKESLLVVDVPRIHLAGKVKATRNLSRVEWWRGDPPRGAAVSGFEPNKQAEFAFREGLALRPGRQKFRLRAWTENSDVEKHALVVDYRPRLPTVTLTQPPPGAVVSGDKAVGAVRLQGLISFPRHREAYRAAILVNGKEVPARPRIEPGPPPGRPAAWAAEVPVRPGSNRIEVRLGNEWGSAPTSDETEVRYQRPPRFVGLKWLRTGGKHTVDLEAPVRSPRPLLGRSIRVEVNGQPAKVGGVRLEEGEGDVKVVRLDGVTLEAGSKRNTVRLWVANEEALCPEPGVWAGVTRDVFPPPVLTVLTAPGVRRTPRAAVRFRVRSKSRLLGVELLHDEGPTQAVNLSGVRREGGEHELTAEVEVELRESFNHLRVRAVNENGQRCSEVPLMLNYLPPPMRLVPEGLVSGGPGDPATPIKLLRRERGQLVFAESPSGRVRLRGKIVWADARAKQRSKSALVRVFVNGFQQPFARLKWAADSSLETPFEATLLLKRKKANRVSLVLRGQDANDASQLSVDCRAPVTGQRLHLLVLSTREKGRPSSSPFQSPPFEKVISYPPLLGGKVAPEYFYTQLDDVRVRIGNLAGDRKPLHDVVVIYYHGGERIMEGKGNAFETNPGRGPRFGLVCDKLVQELAITPGAHVLLLDVDREPAKGVAPADRWDKIKKWNVEYPAVRAHVGVLRYAWAGKGAAPSGARLIVVLEKALRRSAQLHEVVTLMGRLVARFEKSPGLIVGQYIPDDLGELLVGLGR